jgi:Flp pilus assembly protein CpaB
LRTILQNIEVLSINPQGDGRGNTPVITLLVDPEGADMAGLGDSTSRLRLILRNPLDDGGSELNPVALPAVLSRRAKK